MIFWQTMKKLQEIHICKKEKWEMQTPWIFDFLKMLFLCLKI